MSRIGRLGLVALIAWPAGCGLYGEKGFSGKNPLPAPRFIEDVDAACADTNEELDDDTASLLRADPPADERTEDAITELRDAIDELSEELPDHYGPEDLEQQRDNYVDILEEVHDQLDDARDALNDEDEKAFRERLAAAVGSLNDAEKTMRTAGFKVCGTPRPVA